MTTKSSLYSIKSRLTSSNSVHNMTTNGNDMKTSRICVKKPLSTVNFLQNNSTTNGFSNHLKKRTLQLNNFFHSKLKSSHSDEQTNGHQSNEHSPSPPVVFHAIAPASSEETSAISNHTNGDRKPDHVPESPSSRRVAHILAHTKIKTMSTDVDSTEPKSSCSEDDETKLKFYPVLTSIDADADESDNGNNGKIKKTRRIQKSHKSSNSSLQQKCENSSNYNDEQHHSSSNDDENSERRRKLPSNKKSNHLITTTTTTTDDDTTKYYHRYHPLDNLQSNLSSPSPTITASTNPPSSKKVNRFQVKSIRKSQQQILLANPVATNDDCSVPNEKSNLQLKPSIIDQKHTNTPTTDVEHPIINTDNLVNSAASALNTVTNGHHRVRFHGTPHGKHESTAEEEKLPNQTTAVTVPTPVLPSSAQGADDEKEEAIAKSPDNRFIKYAEEIGRGAFKTVYRGLDTETSSDVAWCELQDFAQFDRQERVRFKEEAEMLKKLQHPNIVRFYDFWEETNPRTCKKVIILVTELMTTGSLKGYIRKFKGQKEDKRINVMKKWCRQILKGLAYLHNHHPPVIHRDLKCDNVFISSTTGCVKIGDLGLATFKTQTFAKSMRGTMEFMAPEMFDEQYDELVDVYSFGLCMLEMITGEYPYIECKGPTAVIKRVTAGLKPECYYKVENEDVREVVDCCIRTKKEERLSGQDLLQHSFFLDDNGLRIDLIRDPANDSQVMVTNDSIDLKLKVIDKTKRKALWPEHEAIRFRYNFTTDTSEQIVDELMEKKYIFDEDKKFVIQSINDRLRAYKYEQIDRKAGVFCRGRKPTINQTPHAGQQQQLPPPQQQTTPSIAQQPQTTPVLSVTPTPSIVQQTPIETQQQQQMVKASSEIPQTKPVVITEPIPITQLSDLSSSISGSAGSLEILDAALKKTFNKTNALQGMSSTSTITYDINESSTSLTNQDESSISKVGNDIAVIDQQPIEEYGEPITSELTTSTIQSSTLQTQSQPTTMLTNHQQQILQTPLLLTQPSQSCSYSTVPPSQQLINTTSSNDPTKTVIPSSSSAAPTETMENNHLSISPSHTHETIQSSISSDTSSTTQPPISGSLKQLDALLKNTFKNPSKTNGTAHNSDTETTTIPITINDEMSPKPLELESDLLITQPDEQRQKLIDLFNLANPSVSSNIQSHPNISSLIFSTSIQQPKSQPTSQTPAHFDPLISPERNIHELETLLKTPHDKSLSNDDTIVASSSSSSNDFSEIKLMIMDLSRTLLTRMDTIENKIDEHRNQTMQINNLLTKTVLPSLLDLADIIHETPNLNSRIRTKLENIQMNIRTTTQQQTEMKDLMEI